MYVLEVVYDPFSKEQFLRFVPGVAADESDESLLVFDDFVGLPILDQLKVGLHFEAGHLDLSFAKPFRTNFLRLLITH